MRKTLIALSMFISVLSCFGQQTVELSNWKFKTGDSLAWANPNYNDSGWKTIAPGNTWESNGYKGYDGYAWYRIKFDLPSNIIKNILFKDSIRILLGNIDDSDQTFLNGKLLGQNTKTIRADNTSSLQDLSKVQGAWDVTRIYTIPVNDSRLLWDKENTIAIRVFDGGGGGGMYSSPLNISAKELKDYVVFETNSKLLEISPENMVNKTITVKNLSSIPELKGTMKLEVTNGDNTKTISSKTSNVVLTKKGETFSLNFKGDPFLRLKASCTFIESKTNSKIVRTWESECSGGWEKYKKSPVLGGYLGTIFDVCVMQNNKGVYRMYCSWREKKSIAISESKDGLNWSVPVICLSNIENSSWEQDINRPLVIQKEGIYHMWYTGQIGGTEGNSYIGYATSPDGINWTRKSDKPVISPELPWEKVAVMCPHVIWDEQDKIFKMWYSGGEQWEPDAIGFATSKDGLNWTKYKNNPVFHENKQIKWEEKKVTACQVIKRKNDYLMYYIGFSDSEKGAIAQIGMARSKDGLSNWERFTENPIIKPGTGWDATSCYKPFVVINPENNGWFLYYNGRTAAQEQIGVAIHKGIDLGF